VDKERTEFNRDKSRLDGFSYVCKSCQSSNFKSYYRENKAKVLEKNAIYNKTAKARKYQKNYRDENREKVALAISEWGKKNRNKRNAARAKYVAQKKNQTPDMNKAELVEIDGMYEYHQIFNAVMPEKKWHVDHIQPIEHGGLHHPSNLQILSEHDNCSKGAKWD